MYFTGLFLFLEKIYNVHKKYFMKHIFIWWHVQIIFPILLLSYHCILCIWVQSDLFKWTYDLFLQSLLLEVKTDNTQQENHLHIVRDLYSCFIQMARWGKTIIFIKLFQKSPLGTIPFLTVYERCRYCNFYWYDFALNCHLKDYVGGGVGGPLSPVL